MKDIAIYGAGGLGRELAAALDYLTWDNPEGWNFVGFFDDGEPVWKQVGKYGKILGGIDELNNWKSPLNVVLCFGAPETIRIVKNKITNPLISFPNLIHKGFWVSDRDTFSIGQGNIIQGGCCATTNVRIGNFNLFNGDVVIGHDVQIGDCNVLMPGCRISGEAHIGNRCLIGAMSFIKQLIHVGDGVQLSPLSALLTKPKPGATYIGNPAKIFKF